MSLSRSELLKLAHSGAEARLKDLRNEIQAIYRSFPDLRRGEGAGGSAPAAGARPKRGRRNWTAAQRKAAAERMKKYWASRKTSKK